MSNVMLNDTSLNIVDKIVAQGLFKNRMDVINFFIPLMDDPEILCLYLSRKFKLDESISLIKTEETEETETNRENNKNDISSIRTNLADNETFSEASRKVESLIF